MSFDGIGPLKIGTSSERLEHMAQARLGIENDRTIREVDIPTASCVDVVFNYKNEAMLGAQIVADRIVRLDVINNPRYVTNEGIHQGSSEGDVKRAYGARAQEGRLMIDSGNYSVDGLGFLIKSPDGQRALMIEVGGGKVVKMHVGDLEAFRVGKDGSIWALPCLFRELS